MHLRCGQAFVSKWKRPLGQATVIAGCVIPEGAKKVSFSSVGQEEAEGVKSKPEFTLKYGLPWGKREFTALAKLLQHPMAAPATQSLSEGQKRALFETLVVGPERKKALWEERLVELRELVEKFELQEQALHEQMEVVKDAPASVQCRQGHVDPGRKIKLLHW